MFYKSINFLVLFYTTFFIVNSFAQSNYDRLLEKQEYDKVYKKIIKKYEKEPNDVINNFDFSVFFNISSNPKFNIDTAYYFSKKTKELFTQLSQKEKEKISKSGINTDDINKQIIKVCKNAIALAKEKHNIKAYNYFISHYPDSKEDMAEAIALRNKIAFADAEKLNTVKSFQYFIDEYQDAVQIHKAKSLRNTLAFKIAVNKNTTESFQHFIDTYIEAKEKPEAIKKRDQLAFNLAKQTNGSQAFKSFLELYPQSQLFENADFKYDSLYYLENTKRNNAESHIEFLKKNKDNWFISSIQDSLFYISKNKLDFYGLKYYVEEIKTEEHLDSAWLYFYKVYTADGYPDSYTSFKSSYGTKFPYSEKLETDYKTSLKIIQFVDKNGFKSGKTAEFKQYLKEAHDKDFAFMLLQMKLEKYIKAKNWRTAMNMAKTYKVYFGENNKKFNNLIDILSSSDRSIKPVPIRGSINTYKGGEYVPVVTADNKYMYFCGRGRADNFKGEDIFVSGNNKGYWQKPKIISKLSTEGNDAPLSVSTDGNEMLLFKNSDLYFSRKTVDGWSEIEAFPEPINSDSWEADAMMTSDGKAIIFVSTRDGGHNYLRTSADIYVCMKTDDGWSEPINLGPTINTRYYDRSPFLHPDMKTLYFASSGHGGLGDLDLFKSTRLNDSSWTEWSEPVNMGKEINTAKEDWGYRISTDGEKAYFSARNSKDINDIYTMNIPFHLRPDYVATISGNLLDRDNKPIEAIIRWEDLTNQKLVGESKSSPEDGSYFIVLPLGKIYGYYIDKEDYFPISNNIDLRKGKRAVEEQEDIVMPTFKQMKEEDLAVPINNLFFKVNRSNLLKESIPELLRVVAIIKQYNLKIGIAGHTDNTGTLEYNQELSEKRANAVKVFLILKGISEDLIETIGYGDTKPIATNETEKGKAKNRRVEMRIIE